jgi:hypothetical protein
MELMAVDYGGTVGVAKAMLSPQLRRRAGKLIAFGSIMRVLLADE